MEAMGIRMLFNEHEPIARGGSRIYLAGVDDAHFYRADDIEKAASGIPKNAFSVLLSHTPEVCEQAAAAEFDLILSGHTAVPRSEHKLVTVTPTTRIIDITDVLQSSSSLAHPGGEQPT